MLTNFNFQIISLFLTTIMIKLEITETAHKDEACVNASEICPSDQIGFYVYQRNDTDNPSLLEIDESKITENTSTNNEVQSLFNTEYPFKIIIHGFAQNKNDRNMTQLRNEYLKNNVNLIFIDYGVLAQRGCKLQATRNVPIIAKCAAKFLQTLISILDNISPENFHLIAFSMGAQIAAQIANHFKENKIGRITGLDPALSDYFDIYNENGELTLTRDDATFIDVIHTNSGVIGILLPCGHVDFYANTGTFQPGCNYDTLDTIDGIGFTSGDLCSHTRAIKYFIESINSQDISEAFKCEHVIHYFVNKGLCRSDKRIRFGENVPIGSEGIYYFIANEKSPYVSKEVF